MSLFFGLVMVVEGLLKLVGFRLTRYKGEQASWVAGWALLPTSPLRTGRDPFGVIRLKSPQGTFPYPASLRLTAGDASVYDSWDGGEASWRAGLCRRKPCRECDGHASHSLSRFSGRRQDISHLARSRER